MNTYSDKLLHDSLINELAQLLLDSYKQSLDESSAGKTKLAESAKYQLAIEGDNLDKLVLYFMLDDYYQFIEFGVNGIGYKGHEQYRQEVVSNGLFSFKDNGKNIPVLPIENWIKRKNIKIPRAANGKIPSTTQYAFMLSKTIKKHGIAPRHLLTKNIEANNAILEGIKLRILQIFQEEANEELNKISDTIK